MCRVLEKPEAKRAVDAILRRAHGILGVLRLLKIRLAYSFEIQRHLDLVAVLGMPAASLGLGYKYVDRGELAKGMSGETLPRTH